ncbi:Imm30 family immunity protein [Aerosakkonemataceae cyanobacterium BLCC-F154]|uniref:Imm30 family immunity protein n=1 Tax=Floridaenema fluviatile BLCC-F154 TaxID=3153640 RepID=A0ABV4Y5U3_9CYAN
MNAKTLLAILEANKFMRTNEEIAAFETALAEFAKNPNSEYLRELHLILNDECQQPEVMFSLIHFLESFEIKAQLQAFLDVVPQLILDAPEWTKIIHYRILNDESATTIYKDMLQSVDLPTQNVVENLIEQINQEHQPVNVG